MAIRAMTAAVAAVLVIACAPATVVGLDLGGTLFTDLRQDQACEAVRPIPELAGVTLTFTDPDGVSLGVTLTGPIESEALPPAPGTEGWTHHGCRFFAAYLVRLPVARSYTVSFAAAPPANPGSGVFTGVTDLAPQSISYDELEGLGFRWSFEVLPSYIAGDQRLGEGSSTGVPSNSVTSRWTSSCSQTSAPHSRTGPSSLGRTKIPLTATASSCRRSDAAIR
jgi:hypothetical protein